LDADNVTIDLNGFTMDGADVGLNGIYDGGTQRSITIRNGTFVRWGTAIDVNFTQGVLIEDVQVRDNRFHGIDVSDGHIKRCSVHGAGVNNGGPGVRAIRTTIEDCVVGNTPLGFEVTASTLRSCSVNGSAQIGITAINSVVEGCHLTGNATGIEASESIIRDNVVALSQASGITLQTGTGRNLVSNNLVRSSGASQIAEGINVFTNGNRIVDNHVVLTNGRGIRIAGAFNIVDGNSAFDNSVSVPASGGMGFFIDGVSNTVISNSAGDNKALGVTQNYSHVIPNNFAPVQNAASATNPFANTE
jgi:hypothetical protein